MFGRNVRVGSRINGRLVVKATSGHATFYVKRSAFTAPARFVWFAGAAHPAVFELDRPVPGAEGYADPLPAGGVASKTVKTPERVRVSDGRWRGESTHGIGVREHDLIARTSMFDQGRVNGTHGVSPLAKR